MSVLKIKDTTTGEWQTITVIQGEPGAKGEPGEKGEQGIQGEKGEPGDSYVLTDADKQEIAGMVEVTGGGGSGEGGSFETYPLPYMYDGSPYTPDEEAKVVIEENWRYYKETGKWKTIFSTQKSGWIDYIHTDTYVDAGNNTMTTCYYHPEGFHHGIKFNFNEDGSFKDAFGYENWIASQPPMWRWEGNYSENDYIQVYYYTTQIKIVGYWHNDTNKVATYTISAGYGNSVTEESGTQYYVTDAIYLGSDNSSLLYWKNEDGQMFRLYNNLDTTVSEFTILGYYYWG